MLIMMAATRLEHSARVFLGWAVNSVRNSVVEKCARGRLTGACCIFAGTAHEVARGSSVPLRQA